MLVIVYKILLLSLIFCCVAGLSTTAAPRTSSSSITYRRGVVVGGGPVGQAAALTLSRPPHYFNVTLLEKTTDEEFVGMYDPGKAYLYNVNPRGLQWVSQYPNVLTKVLDRGYSPVGGMGKILRVPADPQTPIDPPSDVAIAANVTFDPTLRSVWIPRHLMVDLMMESCAEQEQARVEALTRNESSSNSSSTGDGDDDNALLGSITIHLGKTFHDMTALEDGSLVVTCQDGSTYSADLVVGADGINSAVRECLARDKDASHDKCSSWLHAKPSTFRVKSYASPSAGLRLKSLQLPGDFKIPNTIDTPDVETDPSSLIVMRSINKGTRGVSLGMLPVKDAAFVRPANVITRPDHEVWSQTTGATAKAWMQAAFPRLPFDNWVDDKEWDRFAKAEGISYPKPQYSPGSAVVSPSEKTGVVLVGDACHAFPPDIGQGINAGLQDVQALDRALQGRDITTGEPSSSMDSSPQQQEPPTLGDALRTYQENRGPEHRALIRLAKFGAPYQYNQSWLRDRIGKKLWMANFVVRMLLSKVTLGVVPPPAAVLMSNPKAYTFRQIMRRCDLFNNVVRAVGFAWAARFLAIKFFRGVV